MALPTNIEDLVHGKTVESARLEFKQGWNPEEIIHTICAFANDFHNWGGGYIVVGVEEKEGMPVLPPIGIKPHSIDRIQKEILNLGHQISPNYFPIVEPYMLQNQMILVMWCPAGDNRPYTAPISLGNKAPRQPFIRINSSSIVAQGDNLRQLQELTARIPFDDRINNRATIADLDFGMIQTYLQRVKSNLFSESTKMSFPELCRTMNIAKGPDEDIRPVNVGLMFFSPHPENFFNRTWIELVLHKDNSGKVFEEIIFKGELDKQINDVMSFLQTNIIKEFILKKDTEAQATRFFNYPLPALEEAISNAVYHKSYEMGKPIEIQIFPDKITILSYPASMPPVNAHILSTKKHVIAREYRNRRIGDFLKELHLTEGRGTGFPTIYSSMSQNDSPDPIFETDDSTFFLVTIPVKTNQVNNQVNNLYIKSINDLIQITNQVANQVTNQVTNQVIEQILELLNQNIHNRIPEVLSLCDNWIKREELFLKMNLSNQTANRKKYLDPLIEIGWIEMEFAEQRTHPHQKYKITEFGKNLQNILRLK